MSAAMPAAMLAVMPACICVSFAIQFLQPLGGRMIDMARTAMIHARTDAGLKAEAETILKNLGLSYTEAINLFLNQVRMRKALPFAVEIPTSASMGVIEWRRQRFILRKSLRVRVGLGGGGGVSEYEPLGRLAQGSSQAEALAAFRREF